MAVAATTMLMVWIFLLARRAPDPERHLRYAAIVFMSIHGILNYLSRRGLQVMVERQQEGAEAALRAYIDVRRISHLDQAIAWVGFFAVAPHLI
jgi:hypothetical protein